MNCERCGENPAEIPYTEVREGRVEKLRICKECARTLGFGIEDGPLAPPATTPGVDAPGDPVSGPIPGPIPGPPAEPAGEPAEGDPAPDPLDARRCPGCGLTGEQLRSESLFGCPECYEIFAEALEPLFRRIHGAVLHRGRLPGVAGPSGGDPADLRRRLAEALRREDYESAARLRDRLRSPGGTRAEREDEA